MTDEERLAKINNIIDNNLEELEDDPDDKMERVSFVRQLLEIRDKHFDPHNERLTREERDKVEFTEKMKTELRKREVMDEELRISKRNSVINNAMAISGAVTKAAEVGINTGLHVHDVAKIREDEGFGTYTSALGKNFTRNTKV